MTTPDTPTVRRHVAVVGGGLAGARAVQELRSQGHRGRITLLAEERHLPYDRPPLTKDLLLGKTDDTVLDVDWRALDVDVRTGVRATGLRDGVVDTSAGEVPHDGLVLAFGAQARRIGAGLVVRTVDDARALRSRLIPGARVLVVGAGWIGAEVATAAAAAGCRTVVVDAASAPLSHALGAEVGGLTRSWYDRAGVDLRLDQEVSEVRHDRVELADGSVLTADVVVVGVGAVVDTGWLDGSGLVTDQGVVVDEHLAATPDVVAAGDCAAWWSLRFGARMHVEHWDDALHGPAVAVSTLLGRPAVHDPVPYFWSDQLGHFVQHAGHAAAADQLVLRGDPAGSAGWGAAWLQQGRLVAMLTVDRPRDLLQARKAIAAGATPDPARLADLDVAVREA